MKLKYCINNKPHERQLDTINQFIEYVTELCLNNITDFEKISEPIYNSFTDLFKSIDSISKTKLIQCIKSIYKSHKPSSRNSELYWELMGHDTCNISTLISNRKQKNKQHSLLSVDYWIKRGYNLVDAKIEISKIQSNRSNFSIKYWMKLGYSLDESTLKVSNIQQHNGELSKLSPNSVHNDQSKSSFNKQYWINHGMTELDAINKVKTIQHNGTTRKYFIDKYGDIVGQQKWDILIESKTHRGESNGMYGKPPTYNSGNSISGYYNNVLFRSLYEYFFLKQNDDKTIIECDRVDSIFAVKMDNGKTYRPDFMIDDVVYEIKPNGCINSSVLYKQDQFRKHMNMYKYVIITEDNITFNYDELLNDYKNGYVKIHENKLTRFERLMKRMVDEYESN